MAYHLEGRLLEVCNCRVLCPCWIGENPDFGTCDTIVAWHFDKGTIDGVDISDRTIALIAHVPGNILEGNWRAAVYLDERVSPAQEEAILKVYTGKAGGPVAELVKLIGEVVSVEKVPITFTVQGGRGTIKLGDAGYAELEPYVSASGATTTLADTVFSTVPGAPVFVGKSPRYRSKNAKLGIDLDMSGPQRAAKHVRVPVLVACRRSPSPRRRHVWRRTPPHVHGPVRAGGPPARRGARGARLDPARVCLSSRRGARWGCGARARTAAISSTADGAMPARSRHCVARCRRARSWCRRCCTRRRGC